jgi:hypothetical protein
MGRQLPPIAGMDYVAIPGDNPDLSFGVIRRRLKGRSFDTRDCVLRRLRPIGERSPTSGEWVPTCYRLDVLLPPGADDRLRSPKALCDAYEAEAVPGIKDLLIVVTLRFPAPAVALHDIWEEVRAFALDFGRATGTACILIMHVPALTGRAGRPPHVHIMIPARKLERYGFGEFLPSLACDDGRHIIEAAWWNCLRAVSPGEG